MSLFDTFTSLFSKEDEERERLKREAKAAIERNQQTGLRNKATGLPGKEEARLNREYLALKSERIIEEHKRKGQTLGERVWENVKRKERESLAKRAQEAIQKYSPDPRFANPRDDAIIQGSRDQFARDKAGQNLPAHKALIDVDRYPFIPQDNSKLWIGRTDEELERLNEQFKGAQEDWQAQATRRIVDDRVLNLQKEQRGEAPKGFADEQFKMSMAALSGVQEADPRVEQAKDTAASLRARADRLRAGDDARALGYERPLNPEELGKEVDRLNKMAEIALTEVGEDPQVFDPVGTAVKAIPGKAMEIVAGVGGSVPPALIGDALFGPGGGEKARAELEALPPDMLDRFAEVVKISPEEEKQNPVAKFVGGLIGTAALFGPAGSGAGTIAPAGNTVLQRAMAVAMENQPELFLRLSLQLESGSITPEQALQQWATETGMAAGAGGLLAGGAKLKGSLDVPAFREPTQVLEWDAGFAAKQLEAYEQAQRQIDIEEADRVAALMREQDSARADESVGRVQDVMDEPELNRQRLEEEFEQDIAFTNDILPDQVSRSLPRPGGPQQKGMPLGTLPFDEAKPPKPINRIPGGDTSALDKALAEATDAVEGRNLTPEVKKTIDELPPVADGSIRVYRWEGEGAVKAGGAGGVEGGVWFEESPGVYFHKSLKPENGRYIDIPVDEWRKLAGNGTEAQLPKELADQAFRLNATDFDPAKLEAEIREGAEIGSVLPKSKKNISGSGNSEKSLAEFVDLQGGLRPSSYLRGELLGTDLRDAKGRLTTGKLLVRKGGRNIEHMMQAAREAGYDVPDDINRFVEMLVQDQASRRSGEPTKGRVFSKAKSFDDDIAKAEKEYYSALGIDVEEWGGHVEGGKMFSAPVRNASGELVVKHAGNINLERIDAPDKILQQIYDNEQFYGVKIAYGKGPKRTWNQVKTEAISILNTPSRLKALLTKKRFESYTDAESFALREVFVRQAKNAQEAFAKLEADPDNVKLQQEGLKQSAALIALQQRATGAAAEAGRTLNALKMLASGKSVDGIDLKKIVTMARAFDDPEAFTRFTRNAFDPTLADKLHEFWINSLVSASDPVNVTSNIAKYWYTAGLRGIEGGLDFAKSKLTGSQRQVYAREGIEFVKMHQARKALTHAWEHLKTGEAQGPARIASKFEHREAIGGKFGEIVRLMGTRRLSAEDEFFAHISYASELHAQAVRQSLREGLSGDAMSKRIEALLAEDLADPSNKFHHMHEKAIQTANENTFINQTKLGELGSRARSIPSVRWLVPFSRVGSSITTFAVESSPIGFVTGGLAYRGGEKGFGEAFARPVGGALLGITAWQLKEMGLITGSRRPDQSERETLWANGWQEDSIYVPGANKWVSYNRLEPFGMIIGNSVDAIDALQRGDLTAAEKFASTAQSAAKRFKDGSWVRGISDMLNALEGDYGSNIERWSAHALTGFAPKLITRPLGQVTGAANSKPDDFTGLLSKGLGIPSGRQRLNPYGQNEQEAKDFFDKTMTALGFRSSTKKDDPVLKERIRLGVLVKRIDFPKSVDAKKGIDEKKMFEEATNTQIADFAQAKGALLHGIDAALMDHKKYKQATDNEKATMLQRARSQASAEFHKEWREAGRPLDQRGLQQTLKRIRERRLLSRIMNLRDVNNLTEADIDRLSSEFAALEIFNDRNKGR